VPVLSFGVIKSVSFLGASWRLASSCFPQCKSHDCSCAKWTSGRRGLAFACENHVVTCCRSGVGF
jgi:hypothetical protein